MVIAIQDQFSPQATNNDFLLFVASEVGDVDVIQNLMQDQRMNNDVVNGMDKSSGQCPLHLAAKGGHLDVVQYFVKEVRADANAVDRFGTTALHLAARYDHVKVVKCLIQDGRADVCKKDSLYGRTALHHAAAHGSLGVVQYLVQETNNNHMDKTSSDLGAVDSQGKTAKQLAILGKHTKIVEFLESQPNTTTITKKPSKLRFLPRHLRNNTAGLALSRRHFQSAKFAANGRTLLHEAAQWGCLQVIQRLLAGATSDHQKIPVDHADHHGRTALHLAVRRQNMDCIRCLVQDGEATVHVVDKNGQSPLHEAASCGNMEIVQFLVLQEGALLHTPNRDGMTPLALAAANGHQELVWFLVREYHTECL